MNRSTEEESFRKVMRPRLLEVFSEKETERRLDESERIHGLIVEGCLKTIPMEPTPEFDDVPIYLFGCCSFEDTYKPGIEGWGSTDEETRKGGYVSVEDYDRLLAAYNKLAAVEAK